MKLYRAFYGTTSAVIQAKTLADARTQAVEWIAGRMSVGVTPPLADEIRVRPMREEELADLVA